MCFVLVPQYICYFSICTNRPTHPGLSADLMEESKQKTSKPSTKGIIGITSRLRNFIPNGVHGLLREIKSKPVSSRFSFSALNKSVWLHKQLILRNAYHFSRRRPEIQINFRAETWKYKWTYYYTHTLQQVYVLHSSAPPNSFKRHTVINHLRSLWEATTVVHN